ncbi:TPA: electron transfer flavoprotein subunit beta/FixA family protein [bacterium]|jgi:electron transfer flavoprotein beta subunit|nr:electron transfer flavoprotein subunit beta/FixA family protein [bacterium]
MNIYVLVKQVPATDKVKIDETTGTMKREEVEAVINPLDLYAIEGALRIREIYNDSHITAVSMGPSKAEEVLKEAISMGCDHGILLSDRAFAGADTWATSYTIASLIKKMGDFSLIITGEKATDGETGQVGPSLAGQLNLPIVTYVGSIVEVRDDYIVVEREIEYGTEVVRVKLPAVISVVKAIGEPRLPTLRGKIRARETRIDVYNLESLGLNREEVGLSGSPTRVVKVFYPRISREGKKVKTSTPDEAVNSIIQFLEIRGIL